MTSWPRFLLLLPLLALLSGCAIRIEIGPRHRVVHTVCVWLKDHGSEEKRRQLLAAGDTFREIPGLLSLSKGRCLPSPRPIVDSSYDVAFIMKFADRQAMQKYLDHPIHQKAVQNILKPLADRVVVYDFIEE
ncbi:MAG: Dabb family protein [Verrucomicrobiales bacterium]|nr:Dabb family protein [Verrucomicrobiales bacterium]